ncbi:RagB/SusD family nutrient uptake outer membrane protein [Mariniphaga sediminis]|uniref:RagB/SusD family nutrient uptake outer membrane protein n=1 Tax=Mariniphaga sediminis TaxID=1628158 RepID=A0A399CY99_9BACT|nr:RagB/SusD family nutrient uptake outer membrane protein [Mariniphaga sediminis]RIH63050.1 RagB/SusD family nutrient uptake outer membrane protein [Mariniphaga sediminis]
MRNKILYFLIFAAFLISCNDDSMNRYPLTSISGETFWNTENDLMVYNNVFYNYAKSNAMRLLNGNHEGATRDGQYSLDGMTDNDVRALSYNGNHVRIRAGQITPDNNPISFGWNRTCFYFVRAINIGLANYDKADISQSIIDQYKAEARLFRGWMVADKVSLYGDYPWIDKELNIDSDELFAERTPRETVMEKVLADLDYACEYLPDDWGDGSAPGRLNRWSALLIKSRVCLFEGTWRKYHGGTNPDSWLQAAATAAKELIDNGPYQLYSTGDPAHDYNAIFQMTDLTGVDEVMYWRRYEQGIVQNSWQIYYYMSTATKSMVEDYLCTDGLPITLSDLYQGDEVFENLFENRDPRLKQTILHPDDVEYYDYGGLTAIGTTIPNPTGKTGSWTSVTGYHQVKHVNQPQNVYFHDGFTPCVILRFGEALLNYAEAKAELGTLSQTDLDISINQLRDRVGMVHMDINNIPVDPRYTDWGVSPLIVEIRRERRIELFGEGFRFDDIRRWKLGEKLMTKKDYGIRWDEANRNSIDPAGAVSLQYEVVPGTGIEYICPNKGSDFENPVFESKHYLWPIPVSARSQNPTLGQNPGWE